MGKRPVFKQADVRRAVRAAEAAGLKVFGVDLYPASGRITIITDAAAKPTPAPASETPDDLTRAINGA